MSEHISELIKIQEELHSHFKVISDSFFKISEYLNQLLDANSTNDSSTNSKSKENDSLSKEQENNTVEVLNTNNVILSRKRRLCNPLKSKLRDKNGPLQNVGFGRVFPVYCYEKGERVTGYKIQIKYYQAYFTFGPYRKYDFSNNLNKTLQEEFAKLKCTKDNYEIIATQCYNEIKAELYKEYPPLPTHRN